MFETIGSWLDWKRSEVSAAMSNVAFNHHVDKIQRETNNNKSFSNGASTTYSKCAPANTSSKPEEKKQDKKPETKPAEETNEPKIPDINITEEIDKAIKR